MLSPRRRRAGSAPKVPAFADRSEAGRALGESLLHLRGQDVLVLGVPRGGVPVAAEVAARLDADLDVALARKLGHPLHPEYGLGAIAEGVVVVNEAELAAAGVTTEAFARVQAQEARELDRRTALFRGGRPPPRIAGRTVVVVDDGIAAGVTARAALRSLRRLGPARLVLATPVAAAGALDALRSEADEVVAVVAPDDLQAVGLWYADFPQVEDSEVLALLAQGARPRPDDPSVGTPPKADQVAAPAPAAHRPSERVRRAAGPRPPPGLARDEADALVARMARHKVVLMGEATHGTHEFYTRRAELSLRLVREHGFRFVAVEGDWPDCFRANRWAKRDAALDPAGPPLGAFRRWPTWMWANEEVGSFLRALRDHNDGQASDKRAGFYGLDVYSLWESLHAALGHLQRLGGDAAASAEAALRCFAPHGEDPQRYARSLSWMPASCRGQVARLLAATRQAVPRLPDGASEARLDAEQNALVAHDAEAYYRAWMEPGEESWNVRDWHMMATLGRLLQAHGPASKGIVWAHNTHVGDARATDMADAGMVNLGQLAREAFPDDAFLLGFSSHSGEVIAGRAWDAPMRRMPLPAAQAGSLEDALHGDGDRILDLPRDFPRRGRIGHRAVGVVYRPEREAGNYVPTVVRQRYDALWHIDRTTALRPLGVEAAPDELPETWPWGV